MFSRNGPPMKHTDLTIVCLTHSFNYSVYYLTDVFYISWLLLPNYIFHHNVISCFFSYYRSSKVYGTFLVSSFAANDLSLWCLKKKDCFYYSFLLNCWGFSIVFWQTHPPVWLQLVAFASANPGEVRHWNQSRQRAQQKKVQTNNRTLSVSVWTHAHPRIEQLFCFNGNSAGKHYIETTWDSTCLSLYVVQICVVPKPFRGFSPICFVRVAYM